MKPQYFGDRNDFCKYAVLRCFERAVPRLVVCWMLTPDDPHKGFGDIDCELFDKLSELVDAPDKRDALSRFEKMRLLGEKTWFYNRDFPNDRNVQSRCEYFEGLEEGLRDDDLVFFDPDTGLEPEKSPWGPEHLRWEELNRVLADGRSVCVYEHVGQGLPGPREKTVEQLLRGLAAAAPKHRCFALWPPPGKSRYSSTAAFLVAAAPDHAEALSAAAQRAAERFTGHDWPLKYMRV
jgi:hypothetical protein